MKKYFQYAWYLIKHKWYVGLECWREGLYQRAFTHDLSKLLLSEWFSYMNYFYGKTPSYYSDFHIPGRNLAFDTAWLKHIHRNDHHWQYWILRQDDGEKISLPMPNKCRIEMVCDWIGAGKAQGHLSKNGDRYGEVREWYRKNSNKMQLNSGTRKWVENKIGFYL